MRPLLICRSRRSEFAVACAVVAVLVLLTGGCGKNSPSAPAAGAQAMEVDVLKVAPEAVTLAQELSGRTSAYRIAEVRARISGIVLKRLFTEGADVKEGDVLFEIDPAPYQAALDSARATLARAQANLAAIEAQAERYKALVSTNAVSKQTYENAVASQLALKAEIAAGEAAVRSAEINLGYTRVTSPISGRIGRASVTEGAYVQQTSATLLATVQQLDPLYVDLSQSADDVLRLKQALASGRLQRAGDGNAKLTLILGNGQTYAHVGSLQFSDVSVSPGTGMVTLRGTVPNPDLDLLPGMFVRAQLDEGTDPSAILVPQSLVSRNTKGQPTAMVVGADNKVEVRVLQAPRTVGNRWLVTDGLRAGDNVIASNLQKIRPGMIVKVATPPAAIPISAAAPEGQAQPAQTH